jgi:two-component system chemotaxis sensor kinase CheA
MDLTEYLPMFLAESREHLQELNLAVVRIEEVPDDAETLGDIFRIAHSLKGMSATMGFERIAALTHAMEDVFELLRQRKGGLEREAIDVLLECLDALSEAFEAIDTEAVERLDEAPLVARLKALIRDDAQHISDAGAAPDLTDLQTRADGRRVLHVHVTLDENTLMPAVRAYMTLVALADHGEVLTSTPTEDEVEQFSGHTIDAWLASEHECPVVQAAAAEVPDVASVAVTDTSEVASDEPAADADADTDEEPVSIAPVADATGAPAGQATKRSSATATVRVDAERLDQLMHLMGELVVHRTHAESLAAHADVSGLHQAMQDLTRSSQALQAMVMQIRMIPVEAVFLRFPRLVRDLSAKLGKKVDLQLSGSDTELDRTVVDMLGDPLVHLVRNSLDHGFETPERREEIGKPATGVLEISARHAGGSVLITVRDDGNGIDPARVARKAAEKGLIPQDAVAGIDMQRAVELLFTAGFSTAETTSDVSGRGVGMDAVRTAIRDLGGEVFMQSETGVGTTAQIRLPLTLAIMAALLVESSGLSFAVQLDRVERTLRLEDYPVRSVAGKRMLVLRDGVLPILDLAETLGHARAASATHAVVVRGSDHRLALAVEHLVGQRELVTRPLPPEVSAGSALSGGAVLSNGQIALIVDCDALIPASNENAVSLSAAA